MGSRRPLWSVILLVLSRLWSFSKGMCSCSSLHVGADSARVHSACCLAQSLFAQSPLTSNVTHTDQAYHALTTEAVSSLDMLAAERSAGISVCNMPCNSGRCPTNCGSEIVLGLAGTQASLVALSLLLQLCLQLQPRGSRMSRRGSKTAKTVSSGGQA